MSDTWAVVVAALGSATLSTGGAFWLDAYRARRYQNAIGAPPDGHLHAHRRDGDPISDPVSLIRQTGALSLHTPVSRCVTYISALTRGLT